MYNVSDSFHTLVAADTVRTRIRIYFISDSVDCTDDADVQANGTLLVQSVGDADSTRRIAQDGIKFVDYFAKDENWKIGATVSNTLDVAFMNNDGALNDFAFGRCKVYLDAYDAAQSAWQACPLGVFLIETPIKRRVQTIYTSSYDQMQRLDVSADDWWASLDFASGVTLSEILSSMAAQVGVTVHPDTLSDMVNGDYEYTESPISVTDITYRDVLSWIAEASASVARFDRNGYLTLKWFSDAEIDNDVYTVNADAMGSTCFTFDLAEYAVSPIDKLQVSAAENDIGVIVGTGSNAYQIVDNPMLYGSTEADILARATPIYNAISALPEFYPINLSVIADWSIEAGDVIRFQRDSVEYVLPIFQQELTWRGGFVRGTLWSSGDKSRRTLSAQNRQTLRTKRIMHQFEVTVESLLSRISDIEGNYTAIEQTVNNISRTVATQGTKITDILDPTGEIWTAITTNSADLTDLEDRINADVAERQTYIRLLPAEPAIVMGFADGSIVKLKLVNNVVYFFNGADTNTDLSKAFMYIKPDEVAVDRFVAGASVQIGAASASTHWLMHTISNGNLVLDVF